MTSRIHYDEHGWHVLDADGRVIDTYATEAEAMEALAQLDERSPPQATDLDGVRDDS